MAVDYLDWSNPIIPGLFALTGSGVTLVAVTSTAIVLRAATACKVVLVKARAANVDKVYIGAAGVTANEAALTGGLQLAPGDMIALTETDLSHLFINGTLGDGVSYTWFA